MSRRGFLGGVLGAIAAGPTVAKDIASSPVRVRGVSRALGGAYGIGAECMRVGSSDHASAVENALNTPYIKGLLQQNYSLREFVHDLGDAPCVLNNKSNSAWFRRMATKRTLDRQTSLIDQAINTLGKVVNE